MASSYARGANSARNAGQSAGTVESQSMEAILAAVQPYDIHGTRYYRIAYALKEQPDRVTEGRVAVEGIYPDPKAGDRIEIRMVLGIIDSVKRLDPAAD